MINDYKSVTEISGDSVSYEQVERIQNRYCWAKKYCENKDVLEVACGSGQGLGLINSCARSFTAGDYSASVLKTALDYYKNRIPLKVFDAQEMPFEDNKFDTIIIFEAIYYLPNFVDFLKECRRVLKSKGRILISMPNTKLTDFNKSPHSYKYFNIEELKNVLNESYFDSEFFGYLNVKSISLKQKIFRPIKKIAVDFNLIPKTMAGKKILKRIVFGKLVKMPNEVVNDDCENCKKVEVLDGNLSSHKVIYCVASLKIRK
ncbi:class I SAM-dependent methyltransferase [Methylophilaceae bacterium]|nr:class I SAM-dependent methyltransferase [Methylophilaceae bacterium]